MLLLSRRGKRMGKEEWREISRQREGSVPAPGHLGSHSPSLPTGGKWKLLPGREAVTKGASARCGASLPHPQGRVRRSLLSSRTQPRPLPPAEAGGGSPAVSVTQAMPEDPPARYPSPGPAARPLPPPPHTSNPAVGLSLARFPPQRRSSVAAAAEAAAAATESSIPAGATWNSRASSGAPGSRGLQPLRRTARLTPAPSRTQ